MRLVRATAVLLALAVGAGGAACSAAAEPLARTPAATPATTTPPAGPAPPSARELAAAVFRAHVTADDVARASGDERLALSLVTDGQDLLTLAEFREAGRAGEPVARFRYGRPRFFVPRLDGYPRWFLTAVDRRPVTVTRSGAVRTGAAATVLMVFVRKDEDLRWQLTLRTTLAPRAELPEIALDDAGYATALATFDSSLMVSPRMVGALHATMVEDGPQSQAGRVVAAGRFTSDMHAASEARKRRMSRAGLVYNSIMSATGFPEYALRLADGGGLVLYALARDSLIVNRGKRRLKEAGSVAHLLSDEVRDEVRRELSVGETLQFAAVDPVEGKLSVLAHDGAATRATGK